MNGIQTIKPASRKCNRPINAVVPIMKYKKSTIEYAIYTKVFSDITVSYLMVYTDDVMNTNNKETEYTDFKRVFEE